MREGCSECSCPTDSQNADLPSPSNKTARIALHVHLHVDRSVRHAGRSGRVTSLPLSTGGKNRGLLDFNSLERTVHVLGHSANQ